MDWEFWKIATYLSMLGRLSKTVEYEKIFSWNQIEHFEDSNWNKEMVFDTLNFMGYLRRPSYEGIISIWKCKQLDPLTQKEKANGFDLIRQKFLYTYTNNRMNQNQNLFSNCFQKYIFNHFRSTYFLKFPTKHRRHYNLEASSLSLLAGKHLEP